VPELQLNALVQHFAIIGKRAAEAKTCRYGLGGNDIRSRFPEPVECNAEQAPFDLQVKTEINNIGGFPSKAFIHQHIVHGTLCKG
jgi:hypothetical protein